MFRTVDRYSRSHVLIKQFNHIKFSHTDGYTHSRSWEKCSNPHRADQRRVYTGEVDEYGWLIHFTPLRVLLFLLLLLQRRQQPLKVRTIRAKNVPEENVEKLWTAGDKQLLFLLGGWGREWGTRWGRNGKLGGLLFLSVSMSAYASESGQRDCTLIHVLLSSLRFSNGFSRIHALTANGCN